MFIVLEGGKKPTRGTKHSACVDLYAKEDIKIYKGETEIVKLGVKLDLDELYRAWFRTTRDEAWSQFLSSHYLKIAIRSSMSAKYGLVIANGEAIVDLDYPDEIGLIVYASQEICINKGDRIAQCTLVPHRGYLMGIESDEERTGGFGSTGKN